MIELCNETSYILETATALQSGAASQSRGWDKIRPGICLDISIQHDTDRQIYVYARSIAAHAGNGQRYMGSERFCILNQADFEIDGRRECRERNYETADFARVDMRANKPSVSFTDPLNFGLKRARIAGAQRLLQDIGYDVGHIDGLFGRRTRDAIADFRQKNNLPERVGLDDRLIAALEQAINQQSSTRGLMLCNKTPDLIWAAMGWITFTGFFTQGWLEIQPDSCKKAINTALKDRYYFIYAEAVDANGNPVIRGGRRQLWTGDFNLCTKPTRFAIDNHDDCAARGMDRTGFMKIDTGAQTSWMMDFE